jgi:hypothetical protein
MNKYKKLDINELATLFIEYTSLYEKLYLSNQKHLANFLGDELMVMRRELRRRGVR